MRRKIVIYSLLTLVTASFVGVQIASANGFGFWGKNMSDQEFISMHTSMFQRDAEKLGMSIDEYKAAWAEGKSFFEIAESKGISKETLQARMQEERKTEMKNRLATLVSQGVITQAQADARISAFEAGKGNMGMKGRGGEKGSCRCGVTN